MDPLSEKYHEVAPYVFTLNNPIKYYDPDGKIVVFAHLEGRIQTFIPTFNLTGGIAIDHKGNIGIYYSVGIGLGGGVGLMGGISFGSFPAIDATINDIEGFGADLGGFAGVGAAVSGEINAAIGSEDYRLGLTPYGFTGGFGGGIYLQASYLKMVEKFNINSLLKNDLKGLKGTLLYSILRDKYNMNDDDIKEMLKQMYFDAIEKHRFKDNEKNDDQDRNSEEENKVKFIIQEN